MKRGKLLQGLESEKIQNETALDTKYASKSRGLSKKRMSYCNDKDMPTYSLYIVESSIIMLIYKWKFQ